MFLRQGETRKKQAFDQKLPSPNKDPFFKNVFWTKDIMKNNELLMKSVKLKMCQRH